MSVECILQPGSTFHGRYQVVRPLKSGGMGAIYEVCHCATRRRLALKALLPWIASDPEARGRFELEARVTAEIDSDHIVEVVDAGVDEQTGLPFLVMELLKGEDLGSLLDRRGALPPEEAAPLLDQAARALDKLHAAGIVHRDLKPENLFVSEREDGSRHLKLLDFGTAKLVEHSPDARTTRNIGTPLYMSPEQIRGDGDIGGRADLYSFGHIAFALLTGEPYWAPVSRQLSSTHGLLLRILAGASDAASAHAARAGVQLPAALDAWFARATALRAEDRHLSARELVDELRRGLELPACRLSSPSLPPPLNAGSLPPPGNSRPVLPDHDASEPRASAVRASDGRARPTSRSRWPAVVALAVALVGAAAILGVLSARAGVSPPPEPRAPATAAASVPRLAASVLPATVTVPAPSEVPSERPVASPPLPARAPRTPAVRPRPVEDPTDTR